MGSYLNFDNVNRIPASLDHFWPISGLLDEDDPSKTAVQVPQVDGGHSALEVELAVLKTELNQFRPDKKNKFLPLLWNWQRNHAFWLLPMNK